MKKIVQLARELRSIAIFKVTTRAVVITLMLLGIWVATKKLEFPQGVSVNDKVIHVIVFFGFAVLIDLASSLKPFWLWKGLPLILYGVGIEVAQFFTEFRSFSIADIVADFVGILLYFLLKFLVLFAVKHNRNNSKSL